MPNKQNGQRYEIERLPYMTVFQEPVGDKDTYGGEAGFVVLEQQLIRPKDRDSDTIVVFSHPIGRGAYLPICGGLAHAGFHVAYLSTRYVGNDTALIMEKCAMDLGAGIKDLKQKYGYKKVVMGGWSGGGSLSLFMQEQAEKPSITHTPAGDPADLVAAALEPADGIMLLAAHVSRALTLTEWMDPSIKDEADPENKDIELDLYHPDGPQPPYDNGFLTRFRAAQVNRNRKITAWAEAKLRELKADGRDWQEFGFVVHGTMSDPRFFDASIDPNDREIGTCYLGDPKVINMAPIGLARFTTLRSWLSQWSYDKTNANGIKNAANISCPVLVVGNRADNACTPSHTYRLYDAVGHDDKELYEVEGATHYYSGQPEHLQTAIGHIRDWMEKKGFEAF